MLPWRCLLIILWGVVCCAGYGMMTDGTTTFVNASACTVNFLPMNPPIVIDLPNPRTTWRPSQGKTPSELLPSPRGEEQWGRGRGGDRSCKYSVYQCVVCVCVWWRRSSFSPSIIFSPSVQIKGKNTCVSSLTAQTRSGGQRHPPPRPPWYPRTVPLGTLESNYPL